MSTGQDRPSLLQHLHDETQRQPTAAVKSPSIRSMKAARP